MAEIYLLNISNKEEYEVLELKKRVCGECRKRAERFRFIDDARRYLYGIILIQYIIKKKFGVDFRDYTFSTNEYGKPYILEHSEWQFNISHSGTWVICGFGNSPIGVDIEQIIPCNRVISKQIFSNKEYQYAGSLQEAEQTELFFRLWTLKESYTKYVGKGLRMPFHKIEFVQESNGLRLHGIEKDNPFLSIWNICSGYMMAVCTEEERTEHIYISKEELFSAILLPKTEKKKEAEVYV